MFSKHLKEERQGRTIRVASCDAPNDFHEVTISLANSIFFKALAEIRRDFEETGKISEPSLVKFRDSTPLARQRITELKSMKKTFLKELDIEAKKGNETIKKSLIFYEALVEADRLRSTKPQREKGKPGNSKKD